MEKKNLPASFEYWSIKHFSPREFRCKCNGLWCKGFGEHGEHPAIDLQLLLGLELLRTILDKPIQIVSGFRCEQYNKTVGGVKHSQHLLGRAADVRVTRCSPDAIKTIADAIPVFHEGGIGIYDTFTHLDVRGEYGQRRARWNNSTKKT